MIYRKLSIEDIELVVEMNQNFREGFIEREYAERFLMNPENWLFAAVDNDKIIIEFIPTVCKVAFCVFQRAVDNLFYFVRRRVAHSG